VLSKTANGLPVYLRRKLVEALGWFGAEGMPEIVDFLGDENSEVAEAAIEQFELALEDITLGDRARAEIVAMASKALHDRDALERIFMEISNMRNSVAVPVLVDICKNGTDEARELSPETISFVTGTDEGEIVTVDDIQKWLGENPDGEDDEDLYGPMDVD
jgi:HEAT repeat protein